MIEKLACVTLGKRKWKRVKKQIYENIVFKYEMSLKEVKDDDYIRVFLHQVSKPNDFVKVNVAENREGMIIFYASEKPHTPITVNICRMNRGD